MRIGINGCGWIGRAVLRRALPMGIEIAAVNDITDAATTGDRVLLDAPHKDLRRARSAAANIVPTMTGAARMIGEVLPELAGRLDGVAIRVPVEDGSITDPGVVLSHAVTAEQVNRAFAAAADEMHSILRYSTDPLVSRDVIGDPASCVFDSALTQADDELVKVFG